MKLRIPAVLLSASSLVFTASGQGIQINKQNRTISVTASASLEVEPEVAVVQVGYHNFAPTQDAAYSSNGEVSGKVINALLAAGLRKDAIETEAVSLQNVSQLIRDSTPEERAAHQFEARQTWAIHVPVADAGRVVDQSIASGANEISGVDWTVADPAALDARVNKAAVSKARLLAEAMAEKLGAKVGMLLYASNSNPPQAGENRSYGFGGGYGMSGSGFSFSTQPVIRLVPHKVRRDATVYAVFALE